MERNCNREANKICIYTEAGPDIGFGHLIRCMALYDKFESKGSHLLMVINGDDSVKAILGERKFILDVWYDHWFKYLDENSKDQTYCIIDSYIASEKTYYDIQKKCRNIIYLDDTNRINYPPGIVVNPSICCNAACYTQQEDQVILSGLDYIIVREAFQTGFQRIVREEIEDILIILGGSDVKNLTPQIVCALNDQKYRHINKHVVIGGNFSKTAGLISTLEELDNVHIYVCLQSNELCLLMEKSDFAITTAGQTIYELIEKRLPFLCIKVIENQADNIKGLLQYEIIDDFWDACENVGLKDLNEYITQKIERYWPQTVRQNSVNRMEKINIGGGVNRIAEALIGKADMNDSRELLKDNTIELRKIRESDLEKIMNWRMLAEVTKYMYTDPVLNMDIQREWLERISNDSSCKYWIITVDGISIGVVGITDIDRRNLRCNWNWYIGELDYRGMGIAQQVQCNICDYVFDLLMLNRLYSEVLTINQRNIRAYEKCGYKVEGILKEHILKNGSFYDVAVCGITKSAWNVIKNNYAYDRVFIEE